MTGHLCLKWNNHSSAFVHSISTIQIKEKYCDATIICQGQYYSVHRVVLSTCSEYFEEMFERIQCQHPYIVFKDIEPNEMGLLLNYMYQGEVNVIQESLPNLIKAAEALKIKGLAVPDDIPTTKETSSRKRSNTNNDTPSSKRKLDERKHKTDSPTINRKDSETSEQQKSRDSQLDSIFENAESKSIKQEPEEFNFVSEGVIENSKENESTFSTEENSFLDVSVSDFKTENDLAQEQNNVAESNSSGYEDQPFFQSLNLSEFPNCTEEEMSSDTPNHDAICDLKDIMSNRLSLDSRRHSSYLPSSSQAHIEEQRIGDQSSGQIGPNYVGKAFRCSMCGYDCNSVKDLRQHIRHYHTDPKRFSCPFCRKVFITKQHFHRHMLIHTGEKPYTCPRCLKGFRVKHHLKYHLNKKLQCSNPNIENY